jgi:serine/threonine protein kinase
VRWGQSLICLLQVRGKELDARTDLFSFGTVLYEMCTGTLPFRGDTRGVIFESILNRVPAPAIRLNPDLPHKLEEITSKALEKDRDVRYQHASEIKADLKRVKRDSESSKITLSESAKPRWLRHVMLIGAIALVSITSAFRYKQREIEPQKVAKELGVEALVTGELFSEATNSL